jgi:hypothetical protein
MSNAVPFVLGRFNSLFGIPPEEDWRVPRPRCANGDFNGDGVQDAATIAFLYEEGWIQYLARHGETTSKSLGLLKPGLAGYEHLSLQAAKAFLSRPVLLVVLGEGRRRRAARPGVAALFDFTFTGATRMEVSRRPLAEAYIGDEPLSEPPELVGDALHLVDAAGEGLAIYWRSGTYHWYPVK